MCRVDAIQGKLSKLYTKHTNCVKTNEILFEGIIYAKDAKWIQLRKLNWNDINNAKLKQLTWKWGAKRRVHSNKVNKVVYVKVKQKDVNTTNIVKLSNNEANCAKYHKLHQSHAK